jgi:ribosomal subunit interface protein
MKMPLQIVFHGMDASEAVEAAAREKASKLDHFSADIMACRVTIELEHKHRQQGRPFAVRIDLTLPGHELRVDRVEHEDIHVALRDAFDGMKRQLEDVVRRTRGQQKHHAEPLHGTVARLDANERFGFIRTHDGDEYWFGPDNLEGARFETLQVGAEVRFLPEVAAEGRQAKRVSLGKHHVG